MHKWILALLAVSAVNMAPASGDTTISMDTADWTRGAIELDSIGPLAFGPDGVLFLGDPEGAAIYALKTSDKKLVAASALKIEAIDAKLAAMMGTGPDEVRFHDLAVSPATGTAYLSVTRGGGDSAQPVLVRVATDGSIEVLELSDVEFQKASLSDAPEAGGSGRRNKRAQSITDLAFHDGRVFVAGLSNEEFASKLRGLYFPFDGEDSGTNLEIYHGKHGAWETRSPVRSFVPMNIGGKPHLLCGYTCTPLVKFPVSDLVPEKKLRGTTVAELGNRNTPLDMITYKQKDAVFLLIANTSRGVMKVSTAGIEKEEGLTERVADKAGLGYDTIEDLVGVTQLAAIDNERALVLLEPKDGAAVLRVIDLP